MNFNNYDKQGMGLHEKTIEAIYRILQENSIRNIVEFGSGGSTEFFTDANEHRAEKYHVDSFDHLEEYSFKGPFHSTNLMIRPLIACGDLDFDFMFKSKMFDRNLFNHNVNPNDFAQRNSFYDVSENDLKQEYELALIDGPNGNGRSLSFLFLKDRMKSGSYIVIDDFYHYDFVERCMSVIDCDIVETRRLGASESSSPFAMHMTNKGHAILRVR